VIHCYSYDVETAKKLLDLGIYLSVPGNVTYRNAGLPKIVRYAPLDRLLYETDSPFLTPEPKRGERNEPAMVRHVVEEIARLKEMPVDETASLLARSFETVFHRLVRS
jgi:TatD DNase family protein